MIQRCNATDANEPQIELTSIYRAGAAGNFLAPVTGLSPNAFKSVIDIDVLGSYNTVKACLPHLEASAKKHSAPRSPTYPTAFSDPARLLFISATIHYTALPLQAHVAAAKAAVDALSASCAIELGPRGITSNVISPGAIAGTEGMERLAPPGSAEAQSRATPLGRMGTIRDVADATVWLCSEAGRYINGTVVVGKIPLPYVQRFGEHALTILHSRWRFLANIERPWEDLRLPRLLIKWK